MAKQKYFVGNTYDVNGKQFKLLEIIKADRALGISNTRGVIRFTDTGYTCNVQLSNIPAGKVKDRLEPTVYGVGCIGSDLKIPSRGNGIIRRVYDLWANMLKRCYNSSALESNSTYTGVVVEKRWLNFTNFLNTIHLVDGYELWESGADVHLDKDLSGERLYSLNTCKFIQATDNVRECP